MWLYQQLLPFQFSGPDIFYQRLDLIQCILKGPPNIWLYELVRKCDGKEDEKCVNLWLINSSFFTQNNKYAINIHKTVKNASHFTKLDTHI